MFTKDTKTAKVSRQTYIDGDYKKSQYSETGGLYKGHLKALSLKEVSELSNFGKEFAFHTRSDADIREGDKLTIEGTSYDVKGLSVFDGITFSRLMCIVQKG